MDSPALYIGLNLLTVSVPLFLGAWYLRVRRGGEAVPDSGDARYGCWGWLLFLSWVGESLRSLSRGNDWATAWWVFGVFNLGLGLAFSMLIVRLAEDKAARDLLEGRFE